MACSLVGFPGLLKKRLLAAWKAACKRGKMNVSGEPKETAVSREIMPADGSNPAQRNERGFRHVPAYRRAAFRRVGSLSVTDGRGKE
jgi:hypothetical protein